MMRQFTTQRLPPSHRHCTSRATRSSAYQIFGATETPLRLSDVTLHAQMMPAQDCTAAVHADLAIPGSFISVLRVADSEAAGKVLSTVCFEQTSH